LLVKYLQNIEIDNPPAFFIPRAHASSALHILHIKYVTKNKDHGKFRKFDGWWTIELLCVYDRKNFFLIFFKKCHFLINLKK